MRQYDFVAIGGGSAGLAAVARVTDAGKRAAVVDRGRVGGLCSLNGCNPKKVLVRTTELLDEIRRAEEFGIQVGEPRVDWSRVIDRKEQFTRDVTPSTKRWLEEKGIDLLQGTARFNSCSEMEFHGESIEAQGFLVATGSKPRLLDIEGANLLKTSDDMLAMRSVPPRLAIIGAGPVAFELGQVFARAGSHVTMFSQDRRILERHDADLVETLVRFTEGLGIELIVPATVNRIHQKDKSLEVEYETEFKTEAMQADVVFNAAGRVPSLDGLAFEQAGVETDEHGVVVNDFLRSPSNPHVFAAGDAHGRL